MIAYYRAVRQVATRIADAIARSVSALQDGRVEQEPALTDRMLGAVEESMNGFTAKGISWNAKTLTDRAQDSQESRYGADFMGVLRIDLPEFSIAKGFLAQAKLKRNGRIRGIPELKRQCEKMLKLSSQSFVFIYDIDAVRVISANDVIGAEDPLLLYSQSAQTFFENHLKCIIGDRSISSPTPAGLQSLADEFVARSALRLQARGAR
jgi:hypothetical protein